MPDRIFIQIRPLLLLSLALSVLMMCGCANLPFFNRANAQPNAPAEATETVESRPATAAEPDLPDETARVDTEREAALRALPERTVVLDEKPPGLLKRWWQSIFKPKKPEFPVASAPLWIGSIKVVNARDRYVLIDSALAVAMPPGEILNSVGNDFESGSVRTTADRVHPFFIADIVSGNPAVGDRVYSPQQ